MTVGNAPPGRPADNQTLALEWTYRPPIRLALIALAVVTGCTLVVTTAHEDGHTAAAVVIALFGVVGALGRRYAFLSALLRTRLQWTGAQFRVRAGIVFLSSRTVRPNARRQLEVVDNPKSWGWDIRLIADEGRVRPVLIAHIPEEHRALALAQRISADLGWAPPTLAPPRPPADIKWGWGGWGNWGG